MKIRPVRAGWRDGHSKANGRFFQLRRTRIKVTYTNKTAMYGKLNIRAKIVAWESNMNYIF